MFVTEHAVIVLDGATALEPVPVDPATYAQTLGTAIAEHLDRQPDTALPDVVAERSPRRAQLHLHTGHSPSSTVTILRALETAVDLYVLGDSPIHYGTDDAAASLTDNRLAAVAPVERQRYIARLRAGHGYDEHHRETLVALQRAQRAARNTPDGYWIAEADPEAAHHAITRTLAAIRDRLGRARHRRRRRLDRPHRTTLAGHRPLRRRTALRAAAPDRRVGDEPPTRTARSCPARNATTTRPSPPCLPSCSDNWQPRRSAARPGIRDLP